MPGGLKELRRRLLSIKSTSKITYAMKLVSTARLRHAQEAVLNARQYTNAIVSLISSLPVGDDPSLSHPFLVPHDEIKKRLFIVVGASRGLCGSYNSSIHKTVDFVLNEEFSDKPCEFVLIGKKPVDYFKRRKRAYLKGYSDLSDDPGSWPLEEICLEVEKMFLSHKVDEVYIIYTRFKSAISTTVLCEKLLPMSKINEEGNSSGASNVALFEPSPREVFRAVVPRIFRVKVRQTSLEAKASEHGSRMTAMESATKNADELLRKLTLKYNKLRLSGITAELLDIIGGAQDVE